MSKLSRFDDIDYIHFVTTRTKDSLKYFSDKRNCLLLLKNIDCYRKKYPFKLLGYCIMPDHLHLLIQYVADGVNPSASRNGIKLYADGVNPSASRGNKSLRLGDGFIPSPLSTLQNIIHDIKGKTAVEIRDKLKIKVKIWQKSFYDFPIYSDKKFQEKLNYIHYNPLKAGLVNDPTDYLWSSYQNYFMENNELINIDYL